MRAARNPISKPAPRVDPESGTGLGCSEGRRSVRIGLGWMLDLPPAELNDPRLNQRIQNL
jgi:hypothetical protein